MVLCCVVVKVTVQFELILEKTHMPRLRGGIRPSPFDGRYEQWMGQGTTKAQVELPRVPIKNQGSKVDCCTAMAVCTAMEMVDSSRNNYIPLSPLFNYYYCKKQ